MENDHVNIVYFEEKEPPSQVKDWVQQQRFVVMPKGLIDTEKPIMRVIKPSKDMEKSGKKHIYFVG